MATSNINKATTRKKKRKKVYNNVKLTNYQKLNKIKAKFKGNSKIYNSNISNIK